ncbi:hypothetical protein DPMN_136811 [Dreissena polymorpha]|uniref:Uncharacterized protein n=1 Tax=Dreissena polymorpha TaxID=45954 RepID=A0A9D4G4I1_DREPO|nr:hypothetical protein DPMN_136811 [Dreissena polymorpha]
MAKSMASATKGQKGQPTAQRTVQPDAQAKERGANIVVSHVMFSMNDDGIASRPFG